jgi:hypothetical protein
MSISGTFVRKREQHAVDVKNAGGKRGVRGRRGA